LHNTVTGIDSKLFIIKSYTFDIRAGIHTVTLHEFGAAAPPIVYRPQVSLAPFSNPSDSGDGDIGMIEGATNNQTHSDQNSGNVNSDAIDVTTTSVVKSTNDSPETGGDYPT